MTCMENSADLLIFTQDPKIVPQELQLERIDLRCEIVLKEKFNPLKLDEVYASLSPAKFPNILKLALGMLVVLGFRYVCKQTFSVMNNKAPHRCQLSDKHLRSHLRGEVASLVSWCEDNNLTLNTDKTKEMIVDTRKKTGDIVSHCLSGRLTWRE